MTICNLNPVELNLLAFTTAICQDWDTNTRELNLCDCWEIKVAYLLRILNHWFHQVQVQQSGKLCSSTYHQRLHVTSPIYGIRSFKPCE
jgi:hypothetical protein